MNRQRTLYERFFKRPLDFILALLALVMLSPILLVVFLLVGVFLGHPAVFKQARPGKDEKIFTLYKLRTMTDQRDEQGNLLPDHLRLTKFGQFLRSTSLDELPELINILRGEMSIVGPRPLLVEYLPRYNETQKHRHDVRPGLTGLAQVNGRNAISWEQKFAYDVEYTQHVTFKRDLIIIGLTILKVVKREGISDTRSVTAEPFTGVKA
jgi:undecaprenyl phosphate N,N'-diacetylbacillosamine 1-phosphate transferase